MLTRNYDRNQRWTLGRSRSRRALAMILPLALAGLLIPAVSRAQTLDWDPLGSGTLSDNSGSWDATSFDWFNTGSSSATGWINGADAVIGAGSVFTTGSAPIITLDTAGPMVANSITFNAVGAGSTAGYTIADGSGTGANTLGINTGNTMTITDNAAGVTTAINAPVVSNGANPFTMNILGTGNLNLGGSIGVSSGGNNGAGTLRVGSSPGTGYSGTLSLNAANNLSGITVNSGTLAVNNTTAALGSGTVTLSGGTLSSRLARSPIAINVATNASARTRSIR